MGVVITCDVASVLSNHVTFKTGREALPLHRCSAAVERITGISCNHNVYASRAAEGCVTNTLALVSPPYFDRAVWREMLRWRAAERGGARAHATAPNLAAELCALLHGKTPRAHGQPPTHCGLYECIAPSPAWDRLHGRGGGAGDAKPRAGAARGSGPPLSLRGERGSLAAKYL